MSPVGCPPEHLLVRSHEQRRGEQSAGRRVSTVRTVSVVDDELLDAALTPRDDVLVLEQPVLTGPAGAPSASQPSGRAEFELGHGPFAHYRRSIRWTRTDDGAVELAQEVEYRLAIPYWARLYDPLVRRAVPTGIPRGTRPWWTTPDRLGAGQSTMVASMALFNLVAGLLYGLLTQVLTFIAADLGDGSRSQQTEVLSAVRLGVVVTVVVMLFADRRGRRRIAVWSFAAAAVLTVVTALAPSLWAVAASAARRSQPGDRRPALRRHHRGRGAAAGLAGDGHRARNARLRPGCRGDRDDAAARGSRDLGLAADLRRRRHLAAHDLVGGTTPARERSLPTARGHTHRARRHDEHRHGQPHRDR